jgi:acetyl-CoA C-acetyltransferase
LGETKLIDAMMMDGLTCAFESCPMGTHAEHIAAKFKVTRQDQDAFALRSQQRAAAALKDGAFKDEIVPVTVKERKGERVVDQDEGPRPDSSAQGLAGLRPVFQKDGTVTAGNASTISDGAAAVVVANQEIAAKAPWRYKILASHTSGTEPRDLFIAPVAAIQGALQKAGLQASQIDLFEINEAFASQMVACVRELKLDESRVNIYGGGISLGHPIGASGARLLVTLIHALRRGNLKRGVASLCLGGGNAVAMVIEAA